VSALEPRAPTEGEWPYGAHCSRDPGGALALARAQLAARDAFSALSSAAVTVALSGSVKKAEDEQQNDRADSGADNGGNNP
jgi:hypothetical protein